LFERGQPPTAKCLLPSEGRRGACLHAIGSPKSSIAAGVARITRAPCQTVFPGLGQRSCWTPLLSQAGGSPPVRWTWF